ncbi:MAG: hypothetical protein M1837_001195 [Sclerophora amabilis]|nr:MAG: hypothetical protein M1837_001195 [Sclerophora amabilis]
MASPQTCKQWTIQGMNGFDSLQFNDSAALPQPGGREVLVKFHAASLNYRDLIIPKGMYPFPQEDGVVPGSDGAGTIEAVGPGVTRWKAGQRVVTLFNQGHLYGPIPPSAFKTGLGGVLDGTLRQYGVFSEEGLVELPSNLNWLEGSTLSCAALTAWNALYGNRPLKAGDTVLTQGTGGVSIFAVQVHKSPEPRHCPLSANKQSQFALAAGATVIATTSSDEKAQTLKKLGAHHVLNYKTDPNWGETAKSLTPGQAGVNYVIEVGGPNTQAQSLKSIATEGIITIIGFLGGTSKDQPAFLEALTKVCTIRGAYVGSRQMFEDMNQAIEVNGIKPVIDQKVFGLDEVKEAYQYMWDQKHFGKICIKID